MHEGVLPEVVPNEVVSIVPGIPPYSLSVEEEWGIRLPLTVLVRGDHRVEKSLGGRHAPRDSGEACSTDSAVVSRETGDGMRRAVLVEVAPLHQTKLSFQLHAEGESRGHANGTEKGCDHS